MLPGDLCGQRVHPSPSPMHVLIPLERQRHHQWHKWEEVQRDVWTLMLRCSGGCATGANMMMSQDLRADKSKQIDDDQLQF